MRRGDAPAQAQGCRRSPPGPANAGPKARRTRAKRASGPLRPPGRRPRFPRTPESRQASAAGRSGRASGGAAAYRRPPALRARCRAARAAPIRSGRCSPAAKPYRPRQGRSARQVSAKPNARPRPAGAPTRRSGARAPPAGPIPSAPRFRASPASPRAASPVCFRAVTDSLNQTAALRIARYDRRARTPPLQHRGFAVEAQLPEDRSRPRTVAGVTVPRQHGAHLFLEKLQGSGDRRRLRNRRGADQQGRRKWNRCSHDIGSAFIVLVLPNGKGFLAEPPGAASRAANAAASAMRRPSGKNHRSLLKAAVNMEAPPLLIKGCR